MFNVIGGYCVGDELSEQMGGIGTTLNSINSNGAILSRRVAPHATRSQWGGVRADTFVLGNKQSCGGAILQAD